MKKEEVFGGLVLGMVFINFFINIAQARLIKDMIEVDSNIITAVKVTNSNVSGLITVLENIVYGE